MGSFHAVVGSRSERVVVVMSILTAINAVVVSGKDCTDGEESCGREISTHGAGALDSCWSNYSLGFLLGSGLGKFF